MGKKPTRKELKQRVTDLEKEVMDPEKKKAVEILVSGTVHGFNGTLTGIQGRISLMLLDVDPSHPHYEHLEHIQRLTQHGGELTKRLLDLARADKHKLYKLKTTDINEIIEESFSLFSYDKKKLIIHTEYQENIWKVEADQSYINQVLLDLYVNAEHAMPEGGDLHIKTENVFLYEDYMGYDIDPNKYVNYVKISVTDTGIGMDKDTQQRIFEQFFTTKEKGKGTGLGLVYVQRVIENHRGIINVNSKKDEGATFTIYLPASKNKITKI